MSKDEPTADTVPSPPAFHPALVRKLVTRHVEEQVADTTNPDMTISLPTLTSEAVDAVGELLKLFVQEARSRAAMEAEIEQEATVQDGDTIQVRSDHCTKVAAEMLMDFS